jgi:hypothetical protein
MEPRSSTCARIRFITEPGLSGRSQFPIHNPRIRAIRAIGDIEDDGGAVLALTGGSDRAASLT